MFQRTRESNRELLKLTEEWEARAEQAEQELAYAKALQEEADELTHRMHLAGERVRKAQSLIPSVGKGWD